MTPIGLIEAHADVPRKAAYRYLRSALASNPSVDVDDLIGDAQIGLMRAAQTYDAGRGFSFVTYAWRHVNGAMTDGLRREAKQHGWSRKRGRFIERVEMPSQLIPGRSVDCDAHVLAREVIEAARRILRGRERVVFVGLLRDDTQADLAARLGVSESRVSKIRRAVVDKLKIEVISCHTQQKGTRCTMPKAAN